MVELKGKSVEVTNPIEYGVALAAFMIAGANIWPWHKGYKPLDEEDTHHTYAWEDCGFLKMAGVFESMQGDYKSPMELVKIVQEQLATITKQRDDLVAIIEELLDNEYISNWQEIEAKLSIIKEQKDAE